MGTGKPLEDYKVVIFDRFCDDVRHFDRIVHRKKTIEYANTRFNEENNEWELNIIFIDKSTMTLKERVALDFIGECQHSEDFE